MRVYLNTFQSGCTIDNKEKALQVISSILVRNNGEYKDTEALYVLGMLENNALQFVHREDGKPASDLFTRAVKKGCPCLIVVHYIPGERAAIREPFKAWIYGSADLLNINIRDYLVISPKDLKQ